MQEGNGSQYRALLGVKVEVEVEVGVSMNNQ